MQLTSSGCVDRPRLWRRCVCRRCWDGTRRRTQRPERRSASPAPRRPLNTHTRTIRNQISAIECKEAALPGAVGTSIFPVAVETFPSGPTHRPTGRTLYSLGPLTSTFSSPLPAFLVSTLKSPTCFTLMPDGWRPRPVALQAPGAHAARAHRNVSPMKRVTVKSWAVRRTHRGPRPRGRGSWGSPPPRR